MRPESRKFLWDASHAAERVRSFVQGRTFADYLGDAMLRSAVERQFQIVGEALSQLARLDPGSASEIPELRRIVAFRNILVHGYAVVDDRIVWGIVEGDLPHLCRVLADLLRND